MKKIIVPLLLLGTSLSGSINTNAWGKKGHTIVVEIAYKLMDSTTQKTVNLLIDNMGKEHAGSWMDEVRSEHRYDYMKPWHYVNIEKGSVYEPTSQPNVLNQIDSAISHLEHRQNLEPEEVKKNILVLMHLIGDIHQPLHVGYCEDKGGNSVQVKIVGKETNLHWVWDSEIIENEHISLSDCLMRLQGFDKDFIERLQKITPEKWASQPRSLLTQVYNFQNSEIDQAYADRNKTIIEDQLVVAGIRLAAVLNHLFKA